MAFIVWLFNNSIILVKIDKVFLFPKNYIFCSDIMKTLMTSNSIRVEYFLLKYCKCYQRKNVYHKVRSSRPKVLCKKLFLEISENSQENTCVRVSFSIHFLWGILYYLITDTHRKKSPLNKIPRYTKSMNMDIWVVVASKQLFIRGSSTEIFFFLKKHLSLYWQNTVLCDSFILYSPFYLSRHLLLAGQFCIEIMRFQPYIFQLRNSASILWKKFSFSWKSVSKLKYWKLSKFPLPHKKKPISEKEGNFENP